MLRRRGWVVDSDPAIAAIVRALHTVAVVGMKDGTNAEPAFTVPRRLQAHGIRVIPVNPKLEGKTVLGEPAYPTLAAVPDPFDAVCVFRRPEFIPGLADEVLALPPPRRPAVFWVQTGIVHEAAAKKLALAGVRVVMDRCLGVDASRFRPPV